MSLTFRRLSRDQLRGQFNIDGEGDVIQFNTPPGIVWEDSDAAGACAGFTAVVFDGSVTLPALAYQDSSKFAQFDCNCIIVNGDLTIDGTLDLIMSDVGLPAYLFVLGDLVAENLFIREQCELTVTGSLTVNNVVTASRWANGRVVVGGDFTARRAYIDYFYCTLAGQIANPILLCGDREHIVTPASNDQKIWQMADWHVLDFDGIDDTDDDDPVFQQHVVFNDYMFEYVPYHQSNDDKLVYWTRRDVDVFREEVFAARDTDSAP